MTTVVSCDPGLRGVGVSVFSDGTLTRAGYVKNTEMKKRGPEAWRSMAREVSYWLGVIDIEILVVEVPQVYSAGQQKGDPDDLIQLAGVDGCIVGHIMPFFVKSYLPREWKGQCPKPIHNSRVMSKLTPEERKAIEECAPNLMHNVIDGIGIGLYYLGRMK